MSPANVSKIIKHDVFVNLTNLLILFETIFGLLLLGVLYFAAADAHFSRIGIFCNWIVFLFGIAFASFAFKEFVDPKKTYFSIVVPVTVFERIAARLIQLIIFYPIIMLVVTYAATVIGSALAGVLFDYNVVSSTYVVATFHKGLIPYLIVFPIFFFGSAYFNNLAIFKTILAVSALLLGAYLSALIVWNVMFYGHVDLFSFQLDAHYMFSPSTLQNGFAMLKDILNGMMYVFEYLSGVVFMILTYLALREREVK